MNRKATQGLVLAGAIIASSFPNFDMESFGKGADTTKARKARKERARMLTRQREEELRAQRLSQKNAG